jgi:autotransporter adhesin
VGASSTASGNWSTAIGALSKASADATTALGVNATASGDRSVSIGASSNASGSYATALGTAANATAARSVALGTSSVADRADTVSVGSATAKRQIVNVAAGTQDNDAVNVAQLKAAGLTTDTSGNATNSFVAYLTPQGNGKTVVAAGAANYKGSNALAASATYRSRSGKWLVNGAVSVTDAGDAGVRVQLGYEF